MTRLEKELKDFVRGGLGLFWQRQAMYFGATLLTGYYLDLSIALFSYLFCQISEAFDLYISKQVMLWRDHSEERARHFLNMLMASSILSSLAVSQYVILVALQEGQVLHFAPLFFLFSAALFAAMNNHQLPGILKTRLIIYGATFIYVPGRDLWIARPPLDSELWMQFGTVLFVLYFVVDCSRIFLRFYSRGLNQIEQLRTERDRVAEAFEMQSQFVSVVSHELRTPLTSIKGALGLLNSGALGPMSAKAENITNIAHKNSNRLANLIDDLLDLQKLEAGKMKFRFAKVNLAEIIQESIDANKSYAQQFDVSIKVAEIERSIFTNGDQDRLMQVMANVLSNAIKFSTKGGVVEVSLTEMDARAQISVRDFGSGIPENSQDKVFGKFLQIDGSDQREVGGTGLGMSITRQILEGHNGTINFTSTLGEGTTFVIELDAISDTYLEQSFGSEAEPAANTTLPVCAAE